jgi:hypothetical protein
VSIEYDRKWGRVRGSSGELVLHQIFASRSSVLLLAISDDAGASDDTNRKFAQIGQRPHLDLAASSR